MGVIEVKLKKKKSKINNDSSFKPEAKPLYTTRGRKTSLPVRMSLLVPLVITGFGVNWIMAAEVNVKI